MRALKTLLVFGVMTALFCSVTAADNGVTWKRRSTVTGELPTPNEGDQQTCCVVFDINGDGNDDIFLGEMGSPGAGDKARLLIWYGDGEGKFERQTVAVGQGIHEGLLGDFDGDGDLDILAKPYHHSAPRIDLYMNE